MISVSIKSKKLQDIFRLVGENGFPNLKRNIRQSAVRFAKAWVENIRDADTKTGWKEKYIDRIKMKVKDYEVEVYAEPNKFVNFVENGIQSFDIKKGLLNSKKVKYNEKTGNKWITIYMSAKVGNAPKDVQRQLPELGFYRIIGIKDDALKKQYETEQKENAPKYAVSDDPIFNRMVKISQEGHKQFGTFRRISLNSPKASFWYHHVNPAKCFSKTVMENRSKIEKEMKNAMMEDVRAMARIMNG